MQYYHTVNNLKVRINKIHFFGFQLFNLVYITNIGLIHLWGNSPDQLINHLLKVVKFHNIRLIEPASHQLIKETYDWILNFLHGKPINPPFSLFALKYYPLYTRITNIPYGQTIHYSSIAQTFPERMKLIKVLKYNPFPPLIPCHRVVPKTEFPGNYTPLGKAFKLQLLQEERSHHI